MKHDHNFGLFWRFFSPSHFVRAISKNVKMNLELFIPNCPQSHTINSTMQSFFGLNFMNPILDWVFWPVYGHKKVLRKIPDLIGFFTVKYFRMYSFCGGYIFAKYWCHTKNLLTIKHLPFDIMSQKKFILSRLTTKNPDLSAYEIWIILWNRNNDEWIMNPNPNPRWKIFGPMFLYITFLIWRFSSFVDFRDWFSH